HDPDSVEIGLRHIVPQVIDRRAHIVDFVTAIVGLTLVRRPVPGTSAIVGRKHDGASTDRALHERGLRGPPIRMYTSVDPYEGRTGSFICARQRLEEIRRDVEITHTTGIREPNELVRILGFRSIDAVRDHLSA